MLGCANNEIKFKTFLNIGLAAFENINSCTAAKKSNNYIVKTKLLL